MLRIAAVLIGLVVAVPAFAEDMRAEEARRFVMGKLFSFNCFEGTRGSGRVNHDGSVAGTIQFRGNGPVRWANLPANTLHVRGDSVCATVKGMPFSPCFKLQKTSHKTFRGSLSMMGMGFAYCDFIRRGPVEIASADTQQPLQLRPTLTNNSRN
jgi:hypothetical protein